MTQGKGRAKGKGKAKRRDPRRGPSASFGKRPGKGTKKALPAPPRADGVDPQADGADAPAAAPRNAGGTAKAPFSVGRAPRPPRPAAARAMALKAERAAAAAAARASAAAPPAAPRPRATTPADTPASIGPDAPAAEPLSTLHLGYIAGATPGRWVSTWSERNPQRRLVLHPLTADDQRRALDAEVDLALVRLPLEGAGPDGADGIQVIPLYEEVPFVVVGAESELSLLEAARLDDLAGQVLIVPADNVLGALRIEGTVAPAFDTIASTEEAIATVAAGVGIVVVPQSLARLHRRKDVVSMPLHGGPGSTVGIAWRADRESADIESFVGVVRGRRATSSR
ncbi:MAG TPA: LysR substrate-binding domain-containing protein [Microbacteriaceae bacterium]|jgi:hypothetical protein|nr:LysR substrate-binding domain-containing protein [Microbacteriaceae bacterium]HPZ34388.1 LysR substrate-binding domain-containing protein [Microbacteriaceae bacterium]HQC93483.1 LysR substrate-binding domain-containing protein [Microbacteriaceae bacterium]